MQTVEPEQSIIFSPKHFWLPGHELFIGHTNTNKASVNTLLTLSPFPLLPNPLSQRHQCYTKDGFFLAQNIQLFHFLFSCQPHATCYFVLWLFFCCLFFSNKGNSLYRDDNVVINIFLLCHLSCYHRILEVIWTKILISTDEKFLNKNQQTYSKVSYLSNGRASRKQTTTAKPCSSDSACPLTKYKH